MCLKIAKLSYVNKRQSFINLKFVWNQSNKKYKLASHILKNRMHGKFTNHFFCMALFDLNQVEGAQEELDFVSR
jgi:hypothetical protein